MKHHRVQARHGRKRSEGILQKAENGESKLMKE